MQKGRGEGSHTLLEKEGSPRPIIVPKRDSMRNGTLSSIFRSLGKDDAERYRAMLGGNKKAEKRDKVTRGKAPARGIHGGGKHKASSSSRKKMADTSRKKNRRR